MPWSDLRLWLYRREQTERESGLGPAPDSGYTEESRRKGMSGAGLAQTLDLEKKTERKGVWGCSSLGVWLKEGGRKVRVAFLVPDSGWTENAQECL